MRSIDRHAGIDTSGDEASAGETSELHIDSYEDEASADETSEQQKEPRWQQAVIEGCRTTSGATVTEGTKGSIAKAPQVQSDIEEGEGPEKQLDDYLKTCVYAAMKIEPSTQISAINKAAVAFEKAAGGDSLQTQATEVLRSTVQSKVSTVDADREKSTSVLSQDSENSHASGKDSEHR